MGKAGVSEMITGVWRIKWWKYRYVLIAAIIVNILLINHFSDGGFTLNPFGSPPERDVSVDLNAHEHPGGITIPPTKDASFPAPKHSSGPSAISSSTVDATSSAVVS